jgi:hypothetical protein
VTPEEELAPAWPEEEHDGGARHCSHGPRGGARPRCQKRRMVAELSPAAGGGAPRPGIGARTAAELAPAAKGPARATELTPAIRGLACAGGGARTAGPSGGVAWSGGLVTHGWPADVVAFLFFFSKNLCRGSADVFLFFMKLFCRVPV